LSLEREQHGKHGLIAFMVGNRVTPNLLMIVFLVGGFFFATRIKKEVFPEFDSDTVTVSVPYPGASPEEVERGIILAVEEAIRAIDGVEEVRGAASEGSGRVVVELEIGADQQRVHQDIQQEVERIRTMPDDAEEPRVTLDIRRREVLDLQIYGQVGEWVLREVAEQVRDRLLQDPGITQVDFNNVRDFEVRIEVEQEKLRSLGLTLADIADLIGRTSVELPGGGIETRSGEILLRVRERRDYAHEFADIPIVTTADGTVVRLSELARVRDEFEESDHVALYNGLPTIEIEVYRVGDQTPIGVSDAVHRAMEGIEADLPPGVNYSINRDSSDIYRQRLTLLLRNGGLGLVLVLVLLGLFLEVRVAFWVTLGIPVSFLGAFLFLPFFGVTINMISLFAFIIALGIVVDDAIVAGENIFEKRQGGMPFTQAAIEGAKEVALPITFSILTNIVAFAPLYFIPGFLGKIWRVIPIVVATVFVISWVESLLILPSHLGHGRRSDGRSLFEPLLRIQRAFSRLVSRAIEKIYAPFLNACVRVRYLTLGVAIATLFFVGAYALSGRMGFILMPKVESDRAVVTARLPYGSPLDRAEVVQERLVAGATRIAAENGGKSLVLGIRSRIDENVVEVSMYLTAPTVRPIPTAKVTGLWRDAVGEIPGLQSLRYESDRGGPGRGPSVTVELSHRDIDVLDRAGEALAAELESFGSVKDVDDGYTPGKPQFDFTLKPAGRSLGLTSSDVARQVRNAFYGALAQRLQRGRNEVEVRVLLAQGERTSEYDIGQLLIRTPAGRNVPLLEVADVERGRAYTSIDRRNGRRTVTVTANVEPIGETSRVTADLTNEVLPRLAREYPGLGYGFEGRQAEMRDSLINMAWGFLFALIVIYVLLAVPFKSYIQPLIVMIAIPFGVVGAIIGHEIMGFSLSIISIMGIVALSGVVVNDSLVMIDLTNRLRAEGLPGRVAVLRAGVRRFRPILLTTLTTYGGLAPMIFETSRQARFMIPMAISLGYGILFATAITLVIVPSVYMIIEDMVGAFRWVRRGVFGGSGN
jgi:multidrug efflux pump subunit AcrB